MIGAIVLAAGESRRMGRQKLLLPFGDTTVIGAVLRATRASHVDGVVIVLGADRVAVRREIEGLGRAAGTVFAVNAEYQLGMLSSIQAGLRALPPDASAAVIVLGDQPYLAARIIDEVVGAYRMGRKAIVIPTFQRRRGHPVLVDMKFRGLILGLDPVEGLRALMRDHADEILEIETGDANILRDLDTPEDYAGLPKPS